MLLESALVTSAYLFATEFYNTPSAAPATKL